MALDPATAKLHGCNEGSLCIRPWKACSRAAQEQLPRSKNLSMQSTGIPAGMTAPGNSDMYNDEEHSKGWNALLIASLFPCSGFFSCFSCRLEAPTFGFRGQRFFIICLHNISYLRPVCR